jgi:hypothetical protein
MNDLQTCMELLLVPGSESPDLSFQARASRISRHLRACERSQLSELMNVETFTPLRELLSRQSNGRRARSHPRATAYRAENPLRVQSRPLLWPSYRQRPMFKRVTSHNNHCITNNTNLAYARFYSLLNVNHKRNSTCRSRYPI